MIDFKKITGGSVTELILVEVVIYRKKFSYVCFDQQPNKLHNPKNILFNDKLVLK